MKAKEQDKKDPKAKTLPVWTLKCASSTIDHAAYHVKKGQMIIVFLSGKRYLYQPVSVKEFTEFTLAKSQGIWFNEHIKNIKKCKPL